MTRVHSERGEVLVPISPIGTRNADGTVESVPTRDTRRYGGDQPVAPYRKTGLAPMHDFVAKLRHPDVLSRLVDYVRWQRVCREDHAQGASLQDRLAGAPDDAPLSVNLDLTTACNFRCDHCVDKAILNTGIRFDHARLMTSLERLVARGLKSVILIGGGEPTAYPGFADVVRHLKTLGIMVGIVTNGSRMQRVHDVAGLLGPGDWVRLSLDAARNDTFARMHRPALKKHTLDWICGHIPPLKQTNPGLQIGFSFIIVWDDCEADGAPIVENLNEIYAAAVRARRYRFDYVTYKPFLTRAANNNAELISLTRDDERPHRAAVIRRIRHEIDRARRLERDGFRVVESTNLRVLEDGTHEVCARQPRTCHMQFFRQVISPLGIYNCPVYRHVPQARLGGRHAYADADGVSRTQQNTLRLIESFDASRECRDVVCLYHHANWFIEDLIRHPEQLDRLAANGDSGDLFL